MPMAGKTSKRRWRAADRSWGEIFRFCLASPSPLKGEGWGEGSDKTLLKLRDFDRVQAHRQAAGEGMLLLFMQRMELTGKAVPEKPFNGCDTQVTETARVLAKLCWRKLWPMN